MSKRSVQGFVVVAVLIGMTSVMAGDKMPTHYYLNKKAKAHIARWSYTGATGPTHWGELNPAYILAKTGKQQSPIDLNHAIAKELPPISFKYQPSRIHLIYNGHTIQENEKPGSFGMAGDRRYELQQFHFHSPSEHTLNGKHFVMELHLVHKADDGVIGVAAVLIKEGKHNKAYDAVCANLPGQDRPSRPSDTKIDVEKLLPKSRSYYRYDGSFTTPPCTEQVRWAVLAEQVELSARQLASIRKIISGNNRPVQPLNGRQVFVSKSAK